MRAVARLLAGTALAATLATPALATWSIVVVDRRTLEACSATATCIEGFGLETIVPLVVVARGAGAEQAFALGSGENRKKMFNGLKNGKEAWEILRKIQAADGGFSGRQIGLVGLLGEPQTYTGTLVLNLSATQWAGGLRGEVGDLSYAIQGNVLTGEAVVLAAERALLETEGDLSQKVMAAMVAARRMGGDGRCSCHPSHPTECGSPPPDFEKSAHQALLVLARPGDVDGVCNGDVGCVSGDYYLKLVIGGAEDEPDPVDRLQLAYDEWRAALSGVPDHYESVVQASAQALVADGHSSTFVSVELVDVDGVPLTTGGARLAVTQWNEGAATAVPGLVEDRGDGSYRFELVATETPGRGAWVVDVDSGGPRPVRLWPPLVVGTDPLTDLHAGVWDVHLGEDFAVPFTINRGAAEAGRPYRILGSAAGTAPGFTWGGLAIPLNRDRLLEYTWFGPDPERFHGAFGTLDDDGRAEAWLRLPESGWSELLGERLHFVALLGDPAEELTATVTFRVLP